MNKTLSILERIVIESLNKTPKNLILLSNDTGIRMNILENIVKELVAIEFIFFNDDIYKLNITKIKNWMKGSHASSSQKSELRSLFDLVVSNYQMNNKLENKLKLQKVYLTYEEERIYNEHLAQLEDFIKQVNRNRKIDEIKFNTNQESVIYWGHTEYSNLIDEALA